MFHANLTNLTTWSIDINSLSCLIIRSKTIGKNFAIILCKAFPFSSKILCKFIKLHFSSKAIATYNTVTVRPLQMSTVHNTNPNLLFLIFDLQRHAFMVMSSGPFNSTPNEEDHMLASDSEETDHYTAIEVDQVDSSEEAIDGTILDQEISEISLIASQLGIRTNLAAPTENIKRQRELEESASSSVNHPPFKKARKIMMAPPEEQENVAREEKYIVRFIPNIVDVHLFSNRHGEILRKSVFKLLKTVKDPKVKFDYCDYERGRFKFVCPNVESKL